MALSTRTPTMFSSSSTARCDSLPTATSRWKAGASTSCRACLRAQAPRPTSERGPILLWESPAGTRNSRRSRRRPHRRAPRGSDMNVSQRQKRASSLGGTRGSAWRPRRSHDRRRQLADHRQQTDRTLERAAGQDRSAPARGSRLRRRVAGRPAQAAVGQDRRAQASVGSTLVVNAGVADGVPLGPVGRGGRGPIRWPTTSGAR